MLEKPNLPDELIAARLQAEYGLRALRVVFLPLGADVNTAVYRVEAEDGAVYFLKLRKGRFDELSVTLPRFLSTRGIQAIIPPLQTTAGGLWGSLEPYKMILYPFVEGQNGYEVALTDRQWIEFGAALKAVHAARLLPELEKRLPREAYTPYWRDEVREFQARVEKEDFQEVIAARFAAFLRDQHGEIDALVGRADELASALRKRDLPCVLCHADIHAGNLLISPGEELYLVDWDNPVLAPKERDLMHIGGSSTWNGARVENLFYRGYGPAELDWMALAFYRYERVIEDIAAFCEKLLLSTAGGEDREQSFKWFTSNFLTGHEIDMAKRADKG